MDQIGEFALSRLEPAPADLRFDWLERAIDTLQAAGLKVVLGTPTATPPRWMLTRQPPDMLAVDAEGRPPRLRLALGITAFRMTANRAEAVRITTLLAERFGAPVSRRGRLTTNTAATTRS